MSTNDVKTNFLGFQPGRPFPGVLLRDKKYLSPEARKEIQSLMRPAPREFLLEAFYAWAVILGSILAAARMHSPIMTALTMFLVASRQNILGLLVHDQAHFLAFRSKKGEFLANLLTGYPLLISVDGYANVHLSHHNYFFTEKDPDYSRKQGPGWVFPLTKKQLLKTFLADLAGINTWKTIKGKKMKVNYLGRRKTATPGWVRTAFFGTLGILFTILKIWKAVFFFWIVPLMTIFQVIIRWGALCEHKYNLVGPDMDESTPLIKLKTWEKLLLPNLNFTYHIYHHFYPGIPFCNLPRVHRIFQRERMVNELNVFRGYGMYLHYMLREKNIPAFSPPQPAFK